MANIVYSDPFGSYAQGQKEGTQTAIDVGEAERKFRNADLQNKFNEWFLPIQQNNTLLAQQEQQAKLTPMLLKNAAVYARLTGDYNHYLDVLEAATGTQVNRADWEPGGRLATDKAGDKRPGIVEVNSGLLPYAMSNPDVISADGVQKAILRDSVGFPVLSGGQRGGAQQPSAPQQDVLDPRFGLPNWTTGPNGELMQDPKHRWNVGSSSSTTPPAAPTAPAPAAPPTVAPSGAPLSNVFPPTKPVLDQTFPSTVTSQGMHRDRDLFGLSTQPQGNPVSPFGVPKTLGQTVGATSKPDSNFAAASTTPVGSGGVSTDLSAGSGIGETPPRRNSPTWDAAKLEHANQFFDTSS